MLPYCTVAMYIYINFFFGGGGGMPRSPNPREAHFGKSSPHIRVKNLFTIHIQIHVHASMPTFQKVRLIC